MLKVKGWKNGVWLVQELIENKHLEKLTFLKCIEEGDNMGKKKKKGTKFPKITYKKIKKKW